MAESMMSRAQQYLGKTAQLIKVLDIRPGANIRQVRQVGVEKLFQKFKRVGFLPVRDCLCTTTNTTPDTHFDHCDRLTLELTVINTCSCYFGQSGLIIVYVENDTYFCLDGMHRITALCKCIMCTEDWASIV